MRLTNRGRVAAALAFAILVLVMGTWAGVKDASNMRYWQDCTASNTCPGPP